MVGRLRQKHVHMKGRTRWMNGVMAASVVMTDMVKARDGPQHWRIRHVEFSFALKMGSPTLFSSASHAKICRGACVRVGGPRRLAGVLGAGQAPG